MKKPYVLPTIASQETEIKLLKELLYISIEALREWSNDESSDLKEVDRAIKENEINFNS